MTTYDENDEKEGHLSILLLGVRHLSSTIVLSFSALYHRASWIVFRVPWRVLVCAQRSLIWTLRWVVICSMLPARGPCSAKRRRIPVPYSLFWSFVNCFMHVYAPWSREHRTQKTYLGARNTHEVLQSM